MIHLSISCDPSVQQMNKSLKIRKVYNYHCFIIQLQYKANIDKFGNKFSNVIGHLFT